MSKKSRPIRRIRHSIEPVLARWLAGLAGLMPRYICWKLAWLAGLISVIIPSRSNDLIRLHRRLIMDKTGLSPSSSDIYRYVTGGILDFLHLSCKGDEKFRKCVVVEGAQNMAAALSGGKGAIAVTAHYSAWELIPRAVRLLGHRAGVVGRKLSNPAVSDMLDGMRTRPGVELIDRGAGGRDILRALRRNTALGILIDQDTTAVESGFVDFFGIPARTPLGPARLALRFGVPILTLHIRRRDDGSYLLRIDEPLDTSRYSECDDAVIEITQMLTSSIEEWIREDPRQWIWFHERWARRPDGSPGLWEW